MHTVRRRLFFISIFRIEWTNERTNNNRNALRFIHSNSEEKRRYKHVRWLQLFGWTTDANGVDIIINMQTIDKVEKKNHVSIVYRVPYTMFCRYSVVADSNDEF